MSDSILNIYRALKYNYDRLHGHGYSPEKMTPKLKGMKLYHFCWGTMIQNFSTSVDVRFPVRIFVCLSVCACVYIINLSLHLTRKQSTCTMRMQ